MKTILFYFVSEIAPMLGGVERVVSIQYHEFIRRGYRVLTICGKKLNRIDAIPDQYQLPVPDKLDSRENISFINHFLQNEAVCLAINFCAVLNKSSICLVESCKKNSVPVISVLHNTLESTLWNFPVVNRFMGYRCVKSLLCRLLAMVHRLPFYKGGRYLYDNAVATVVLAPCYVLEYRRIIGKANNVFPIYNPLSMTKEKSLDWEQKENIALFVGRLEKQKSVDKLIRIWRKLDAPNWKLLIIGSGSQENKLKNLVKKLGLTEHIFFLGHQNPLPYYKKAKLFCLTSIYEGYPMTLIECQAFGVVPILYNSFAAASDIVHAGENGFLVPAFQEQSYVEAIQRLVSDEERLRFMGERCFKESDRYSVECIMKQWVDLIECYRL